MVVLQLPVPGEQPLSTDESAASSVQTAAGAANNNWTTIAIPPRNSPSPVLSVRSIGSGGTFSSTPVTSNLASFMNTHKDAANNIGGVTSVGNHVGGVPSGANAGAVFPTANMMHQQQQPFSSASQQQHRVPASFMHMSQMQSGSQVMLPQQMHTINHQQRGMTQQLLPPVNGLNNVNPPWNRVSASGLTVQGGRLSANTQQSANNLLGNVTVGGYTGPTNPLVGTVTVGGTANRLANAQSVNLLGTVTVGGGAAMANTSANRGDIGAFGNRSRLGMADGGSIFVNRSRKGGAPPRPPLLPTSSTPSVPGRDMAAAKERQYPQQRGTLRGVQSTPINNKMGGVGALSGPNPSAVADYEDYHHGTDGPQGGTVMDFGTETPACIPEVALTSGLVTLSVHEALTFDGVELALHPDVFTKGNAKKKVDKKENGVIGLNNQRLRPGDLVEIRVWSVRPGMAAEAALLSKSGSSVLKSKMKSGIARPSLHSRNTSLATVGSFISNTSLMATPRSSLSKHANIITTQQPPPLPKIVGGDSLSRSLIGSPSSVSTEAGKLYGENLLGSMSEDGRSGVLHGENLLETPKEQAPTAIMSNLSSVFSGFRKMTDLGLPPPPPQGGTSEDSSSALCHSRDSSLLSNSTTGGAVHSRDSSTLTPSGSWMNALHSSTSRDETPQISPTIISAMEPVSEGMPQLHPLVTNLSQHSITSPESQPGLPMRRDGPSLMAAPSSSGPPPMPRPPSSSGPTNDGAGSGTSTPSTSRPSSPKNQLSTPVSTPSISSVRKNPSVSVSQRPPMAITDSSMTREQFNAANSSPTRPAGSLLLSEKSLSSSILTPYMSPITNSRQRASTAEAPSRSDHPSGEALSAHTRNHSIAMSGGLAAGSHNLVPTHRRYRSNISASNSFPSSSIQMPPSSVAGSTSQKGTATSMVKNDDINASENINDILQRTHFVRVSFVMPVSDGSLTSIKSGARTQVSLLRQVADLYTITAYDTVTVTQITRSKAPFAKQSISADFLTITFKDQFVSRGDMYTFQRSFTNSWVYEGKRLNMVNGIRTNTKVIRRGDHVVRSGLISEDTKLTFRSRSARIIWLVQMSSEMWEFSSPYEAVGNQNSEDQEPSCKIYFDKFVSFAHRLFNKWKKLQLTHNLTVVFFSRTYIRHQEGEKEEKRSSTVHVESDGRMFEDHYKIVIENVATEWDKLLLLFKKEFVRYPKLVKWDLTSGHERTPSTATQGNVLEAINITLNLLQLHYIDRDLHRTGNSIVIITPGNGVFEIEKNLAGITKQRMMDNGIGSDMLSLGLPPLHVAPFFLYKEIGTSSAEEIQGFDDLKTYFEVPHWMNLSFVDYDNEEEPMLYKKVNDDDILADSTQRDNETLAQTSWNAANGFLKRSTPDTFVMPNIQPATVNPARQQYKHLISGRGFEDILQACRPRNRGEYGSGLPASLTILLKKIVPACTDEETRTKGVHLRRNSQQLGLGEEGYSSPQRVANGSRSRYLEWGAVNFDHYTEKKLNSSQRALNRSFSGSQSSPTSSFASIGSYRYPSHILGISHLQSTTSLEGGGQSVSSGGGDTRNTTHKKHNSDGSMATLDNEEVQKGPEVSTLENGQSFLAIQKLMADHDEKTFSNIPIPNKTKNNKSQGFAEDSLRNSINGSICPVSPVPEGRGILRSQSAMLPVGGIEAALVQYDFTRPRKEESVPRGPRGGLLEVSEETAKRSSLAVSPLSIGMPYSLDRRHEGLRPSVMRLVAPVAAQDGFQPLDSQRKNSFYVKDGFQPLDSQRKNSFCVSQNKTKSRENLHSQKKMPGQITKESRLGERRNSQRDNPKENGSKHNHHNASLATLPQQHTAESGAAGDTRQHSKTLSPQRVKKKQHGRKPHHHHSHLRGRKPWVLNPWRQDDEDAALAKRTHNRRRWSHVFPLGEDEFKRHSGPNWKSLCQPAILPMTIDFHPSPQDLEDQAKFSVKQYSVTLPPMDETTYKSHTELLDDLLIQRMRQDYQIVPRNIIQQSARRDVAGDNMLEATLSMGHKIQRLSYNPDQDSVDVVQYYARFAEDETPQTYRYLIWSALRQDYVSVFQTFTKYTLPYRWNELDMLISGDTVTTILEGMKYPRISFVIIPDPFLDSREEKEYLSKFQRLLEHFSKIQAKDESKNFSIEMHSSNDAAPQASSGDKRFVVDLSKKRDDKHEWMEFVHDSNCDTRRTFRMTIRWLVAVASKIDQQEKNLRRRCSQYGLKLVSVPHFSCLRSCFMNPFAVPITKPIRNKTWVDTIENALTNDFNFVYDGNHLSDPNDIDCLDDFDFVVNKWSIKKRKKFVPACQYLHRTGTLFARLLRDTRGCAIIIIYLNQRQILGNEQLLLCARAVFDRVENYIADVCTNADVK